MNILDESSITPLNYSSNSHVPNRLASIENSLFDKNCKDMEKFEVSQRAESRNHTVSNIHTYHNPIITNSISPRMPYQSAIRLDPVAILQNQH